MWYENNDYEWMTLEEGAKAPVEDAIQGIAEGLRGGGTQAREDGDRYQEPLRHYLQEEHEAVEMGLELLRDHDDEAAVGDGCDSEQKLDNCDISLEVYDGFNHDDHDTCDHEE